MNNFKNNTMRTPRQLARRKPAHGCEPSSSKLSSQLFRLFPILSVTDGDTTRTFTYHADGQLASATVGRGDLTAPQSETFLWDGLALIQRGDEQFINEPHVGGGNPVASSKGTSYFNDALGTTVGSKSNGKYSPAALSAFGESLETLQGEVTSNIKHQTPNSQNFFTGKPFVEGLGHAFLMRNYRAGLDKWQSADPMGYPDGWNQLAYCNNGVTSAVDLWGCASKQTKRQDPNYSRIWEKQLSNWFRGTDDSGNPVLYSWWERYTETKWDFYSIVEADKTTMEKLVENVRAGAEFTAVVGGVALAVGGLATGGTAYLIAGVVVESAALIDYLLKNEPRTVEIFICSK